jgi:two-component system LytT family sensor kinase
MTADTQADTALRTGGREYYALRTVDVLAIGTFWFLLGIISAVGRQLDPRIPGLASPVVEAVVRAAYVEYALWAVLTLGIMWLTSRYSIEGGRRVGRILLFVALGVVIAMLVDRFLFSVRESLLAELREVRETPFGRGRGRRPPPALFELGLLDDLMVYFAVLGTGVARDYFLRYRARLEETAQLQAQLIQARLDALRSQLNPHFLFNTLNAVSALVERDPRGARKMIARLSDLLRYSLEGSTESEVPLHKELDVLGEYVELMQIRFQGKLDVTMSVADDVRAALVPNLILQPILENAMKHGGGRIEIAARRPSPGELSIVVTDSGHAEPGDGAAPGTGVGLANTNARLKQMYGERYGVTLRPRGAGMEAEVLIPFHTA